MIRHWCEAMGDRNPVYTDAEAARGTVHGGIVAPPTMLQAGRCAGSRWPTRRRMRKNEQTELHELLSSYGYTSVVATNCEQTYTRYLRPGDRSPRTTVDRVDLRGEGDRARHRLLHQYRATSTATSTAQEVGSMLFRVLKFKPAQQPAAARRERRRRGAREADAAPRPARARQRLVVGRRRARRAPDPDAARRAASLRHPPRPMCGACQSTEWDSVPAKGGGTVYSYTVLHHPKFPGYDYPLRLRGDRARRRHAHRLERRRLRRRRGAHRHARAGSRLEAVDETTTLPLFKPAAS